MKRIQIPSKEDVLQYYIKENHSMEECASHFGMSKTQFIRVRSSYNIYKPKSDCLKLVRQTHDSKTPQAPSRNELERLFIHELKSKQELCSVYGVTMAYINKWLKGYGIKKDPKLTAKTIGRTTEMKYGKAFYKPVYAVEKAKKTSLERYGFDNPSKNPEIIQKIKQKTSLPIPSEDEIYHQYVDLQQSTDDCAKFFKVSRSMFEKWVKQLGLRKDRKQILATASKTNLDRYGDSNIFCTQHYKNKNRQTCLEKYGVENIASRNIEHYEVWNDRDKFAEWLIDKAKKQGYKPTANQISLFFHVRHGMALQKVRKLNLEDYVDINPHRSSFEKEIVEWLKTDLGITNIETSNRDILDGMEIDIYLPDYHMGIEFNGEFWHCEMSPKFQDHGGRSTRHQRKSLLAESKGVFLFHIFEHEWNPDFTERNIKFADAKENIKNRLRALLGKEEGRCAARKCTVRKLDEDTKESFLDVNHIQRSDPKSAYALGLYHGDDLVACMSFRKSKYAKYDWELSRFCTKHGLCVQGGASKLFRHFVDEVMHSGENVVSYNDITKTKGGIYKTLGFECTSIGSPNYWWVNLDSYDIRSRYQEQAAGEVERMHEQGYVRICDAGTRTWVYVKP